MALTTKHTKVSVATDDPAYEIGSTEWNQDHALLVSDQSFLGKSSAGSGVVEQMSVATVKTVLGLAPVVTTLDATGLSGNITLTADQNLSVAFEVTGAPAAAVTYITANTTGLFAVENLTSGGFTITFKTAAGTGFAIPAAQILIGFADGVDVDALTGSSSSGSGDVLGPVTSTDNAVVRFDGATGKLIQNSAVTIADTSGDITGGKYNTVTISGASTPTLAVTGTTSVSGANTGDQTSIVGITGTKAQFNSAISDGDPMYLDSTDTVTGVKTLADGSLKLSGATSGASTLKAPAIASTYVHTLPPVTSTLLTINNQTISTTGGTTTLSTLQNSASSIEVSGALVSNAIIDCAVAMHPISVENNTTGDFTVTVKPGAGTAITIPRGGKRMVYANGTNAETIGSPIQTSTWANLPSPIIVTTHADRFLITDYPGAPGTTVFSNGTKWCTTAVPSKYIAITPLTTVQTAETAVTFNLLLTAGFLTVGDQVQISFQVSKNNGSNATNGQPRIGTAGTTADTAIGTFSGSGLMAAATTSTTINGMLFLVKSATTIELLGASGTDTATKTTTTKIITIPDISNALYLDYTVWNVTNGTTTITIDAYNLQIIKAA